MVLCQFFLKLLQDYIYVVYYFIYFLILYLFIILYYSVGLIPLKFLIYKHYKTRILSLNIKVEILNIPYCTPRPPPYRSHLKKCLEITTLLYFIIPIIV